MKLLIIADIHGYHESLSRLLEGITQPFDAVLCPGDFTDMHNVPKDFNQLDIADLVIQKLMALKKPLLCVPGNHDPYEILELFEEYGINLHGHTRKMAGMDFMGFGGAATPFNTLFEPTEEEIAKGLELAAKNISQPFVLMVHNPPSNTKLDSVAGGREHVGSKVVREFIEKKKPVLSVSAHIHENSGTEKIGPTTIFYPGPAYEGRYGTAELSGNTAKCTVHTMNLPKHS